MERPPGRHDGWAASSLLVCRVDAAMRLSMSWPAMALAMLSGNLVVQGSPWLPSMSVAVFIGAAGVLLWICLAWIQGPHRKWLVTATALAMLGYAVAAVAGIRAMSARLPVELEGRDFLVEGRVASLPVRNHDSVGFAFEIERNLDANAFKGRVRVAWFGAMQAPPPCSRWQLLLRLKRPRGLANPGGLDTERMAVVRGIDAVGYVRDGPLNRNLGAMHCIDGAREAVGETVAERLGGRHAARLVLALAVGDTRSLQEDDWHLLRVTGTSHLVAISGLHTGMAALLAAWLAGLAWRAWPALGLRLPRQVAQAVGAVVLVLPYCLLAGAGLPAVRSTIMVCIVAFAHVRRRYVAPSHVLAIALAGILLVDPMATLAASFWLSFAGVALLVGMLRPGQRGVRAWFVQLLRMQWLMTLALMPLGVAFFGQWSLVGMLANVVVAPFVSVVVVPLTLAGALLFHGTGVAATPALQLAAAGMDAMWLLLKAFAHFPHGQWQLAGSGPARVVLGIAGALWCCAPRGWPRRWLGLLPLAAVAWPPADRPMVGAARAWVWDVGQGLSVLVQTNSHAVLVDAGPRSRSGYDLGAAVVIPGLRASGVNTLDTLVLSHGDIDHAGGEPSVVTAFPAVRRISGEPRRTMAGASPCVASSWAWDGVRFDVWPASRSGPANDRSCVVLVSNDGGRLLLPGDAGKAVEGALAAGIGAGPPIVLVAGHHGSASATSEAFLRALEPTHAIVSAGWRNRFGHPHRDVIGRLQRRAVEISNTAADGAIGIQLPAGRPPFVETRWRRDIRRWWRE
jgi:competence protein ComEC